MHWTFKPSQHGVAQVLGELESRVMKALWQAPGAVARDVRKIISEEKPAAATTVLTVLDRLAKKGLVYRRREGRRYKFFPALSQEEFERDVTRSILEGLMEQESRPILSTFVDLVSHDEDLLDELEAMVRRKRR
ncbi:MAG TPA: BlaI/MecI/CopY family transcriptional regulator [Acidobacteriota bacterium]|nr:BlaI/MecI/CopY family transcriptional regulator [Acidobacteriota bacterium]